MNFTHVFSSAALWQVLFEYACTTQEVIFYITKANVWFDYAYSPYKFVQKCSETLKKL